MSKQVDAWLSEEDADLGFGVSNPTNAKDAPDTVPDWARDDGSGVPSFLQKRNIRRHIRQNLRAIHREAANIGLVV
jgi:hypothetical protein